MKKTATLSIVSWNETVYQQISASMKLTKASVVFDVKGDLQGIATVEYLMMYSNFEEKDPHKSTCGFVGLTRFEGTVQGKQGSFVFEESGQFHEGTTKSTFKIVPFSGTDQLKDLVGSGTIESSSTAIFLVLHPSS